MSKQKEAHQPGEYKINLDAMKDMEFGFYGLDQGFTLVEKHQQLIDIRSWRTYVTEANQEDIPPNNLMCYILFLYSPDSPVNKKYGTPLIERKTQALLLSGFGHLRKADGSWAPDVVTVLIQLFSDTVLRMIVDYLKFLNIKVWTEMQVLEQEFEEMIRLRMRPVGGIDDKNVLQAADIKAKLRKESKEVIDLLKVYHRQFYGEAHAEELTKKVHQMMVTVESQAK